jgi:hypothetical protein
MKHLLALALILLCATESRAQVARGLVDPQRRGREGSARVTVHDAGHREGARGSEAVHERHRTNTFLLSQKVTAEQAAEFYRRRSCT